jgi:hypothetical protein
MLVAIFVVDRDRTRPNMKRAAVVVLTIEFVRRTAATMASGTRVRWAMDVTQFTTSRLQMLESRVAGRRAQVSAADIP